MGIFKNILKPFVDFKDEPTEELAKEPDADSIARKMEMADNGPVASVPAAANTTAVATAISSKSSMASAPAEYEKHFEELIEEANAKNPLFQGTDLKEFIDSKIDVEAIADEGMRYKTAFNVLKRTGLTKEKLLTTGQAYINIVEEDLKGFDRAFSQQYKADVEQMEQVLREKNAELKTLTDKIANLSQEIKQVSEKVVQSKDRLVANKNAFFAAGESKKKELHAELEKINLYFS